MNDRTHPPTRRSHLPFVAVILLLLAIGAAVYITGTSGSRTKQVKLGIVMWNIDPFWDPVIQGAKDAGDEFSASVEIVQPEPNIDAQNKAVRDLLAKDVEGIGISPNDPKAQADILSEASFKCPVVTFDVDAPESQRRVFVGIDNYGAGHFAADEVRDAVPDGGAVIVSVGSVDMPHGRERRQGVIDGLLDRPYRAEHAIDPLDAPLKGAKYSVAATVLDRGDRDKARAMLVDALKAHPDTKCIVALFSYSSEAALKAIDEVGKHGQIKVIAFDEADATQAGIENGTIHASILQDTYRMGAEVVRILAEEARFTGQKGPGGPRVITVEVGFLRKDNIEMLRENKRIRMPKNEPTTKPAG